MNTFYTHLPEGNAAPQRLGVILTHAGDLLAAPLDPAAAALTITAVVSDSRRVVPGALFAAVASDGDGPDGHTFVDAARAAGAAALLVSDEWLAAQAPAPAASTPIPLGKGRAAREDAAFVPATDTRAALAEAARAFYAFPDRDLTLVGVTGTNGKTTTAFLLHHALTALGQTAGLVGTVENRIGAARYATRYTTPEAPELFHLLAAMRDGGVTTAALEVSSHGLALARVRGLAFRVAVFTNLTHDHLDFHRTPEAYAEAKRRLFDGLAADATAVVNADDPAHGFMTARTAARVVTYGESADADVRVEVLENALGGLRLRIGGHERRFRLAGRFNAHNLAAAVAALVALGYEPSAVLDALADAPGVPGRFETVRSADGVVGIVDYAHTPDALDRVLATVRETLPEGGRLWVVFGCGGERDRGKRPAMAAAAEQRADRIVITSDNPRTEDPLAILADVRAGLVRPEGVAVEPDRAAAIALAAGKARPGDAVVVAGKGHEDYQTVGAERRPFDDRAVLRAAFAARAATAQPASGAPA